MKADLQRRLDAPCRGRRACRQPVGAVSEAVRYGRRFSSKKRSIVA